MISLLKINKQNLLKIFRENKSAILFNYHFASKRFWQLKLVLSLIRMLNAIS